MLKLKEGVGGGRGSNQVKLAISTIPPCSYQYIKLSLDVASHK